MNIARTSTRAGRDAMARLLTVRRRAAATRRRRLRPDLLCLETRQLLATFVVTDPSDMLTGGVPTPNTLRWAVEQADVAAAPSTIKFELGVAPASITLTQGQLARSNAEPIAIDGPGAGLLTVSGGGNGRVFLVDSGATASFSGLTISGGYVPLFGGNGGGVDDFGTATLADAPSAATPALTAVGCTV